ncbi:hypothetical protein NRIC_22280 [Enterococcus florum]|uniref:UvrABC system protein A n=1 Tax=Enterococcus florum TaxID=2480627 RepID=A0A4P5P8J9_9ENTE|nr:ATP-binding cassette domain-containing protein [Enterococcus florum]GCF94337.1 hypothetical protein NRIC_22280 [Enterococcus florum]
MSGGESQRLKMTKHLNSAISDVLYIFDEPSVGLHPEDLVGISEIFHRLKAKGNTLVLVDHDPDIIRLADYVIELGPKAGVNGGKLTYQGGYKNFLLSDTVTARALREPHQLKRTTAAFTEIYSLNQVSRFNIVNQSVKIPKNALTVVSGVAESGKSTLMRTLFTEKYPEAIVFDQSPIRGSRRSNLLTYLDVFQVIRRNYAKLSGKSASLFSFNGKGGCPVCHGKGYIKFDLAYMGDVQQTCEKCRGKRYNDEALSTKWKGKSIDQLLQLTVSEGLSFIDLPEVQQVLSALSEANLDYITIGQSLDTLSGGERQRLKIAAKLLASTVQDASIFILDEPSTGLHESDIKQLQRLLEKLNNQQKTLIVLEHNLGIISQADWLIDMGPKGGSQGGKVLFQGVPEDLLTIKDSFTGKHLKRYLEKA